MRSTVLGIDISKRDFHVSLLTETRATKPKKFTNNTQGFESLHNWLKQQNVVELHASTWKLLASTAKPWQNSFMGKASA